MLYTVEWSVQLRANVVADYADKDSQNELIDNIFSNSDDMQTIISKLSKLGGNWPFADKSTCSNMKTLDRDYHHRKQRGQTI